MKLIIINGSPRGSASNSKVITNWIASAMDDNTVIKEFFAANIKTHYEAVEEIEENSTLLIAFPLYTDSLPGQSKLFIEELESIKNKFNNVNIYFVIQSGFHGANHSRYIEKYLIYLADYLGLNYKGTAIKPSGEGLRLMPDNFTKKTREQFELLAADIQSGNEFNSDSLSKLAVYEKPSKFFIAFIKSGLLVNTHFNSLLKKNNVFDNRFDKPYVD